MALSQAISSWVDSGTTTPAQDYAGATIQVPVMNPVLAGDWVYTDANGNISVCCDAAQTQAEAEASRDAWLAAGGVA